MSAPNRRLTRSEAAKALSIAPGTLTRWVERGAPTSGRGPRRYDVGALRRWRAGRSEGHLDLGAARARLATAQAEKYETENRVRAGELLERAVVVREGQALIIALKARLLSLPRLAVLAGACPRETEPALRALIVETLRDLARWRTIADAQAASAEVVRGPWAGSSEATS